MAKRRKVGNMLALAILANLLAKPMHPYELATELRERGKDRDMPIKWGSLYTVVGNLEKHDFIRAVHSERQGLRPERTVYEITEAGRAELTDWLREIVGVAEREIPRFEAGLSL
ncbi:MAG: PadR family transcriptional regulator, partial [Hamadaea sp.]|nr:PadR family transcriptional regulator [Hamadaea sp.]